MTWKSDPVFRDPARLDLMLHPTPGRALAVWRSVMGDLPPGSPEALLAGVHQARVVWRGSTPRMVEDSRRWLRQRGHEVPERAP